MRIQTLAAAAVLSLAATLPLSTAAFADTTPSCVDAEHLNVNGSDCVKQLSQQIERHELPDLPEHKRRVNLCDGPLRGIIDDERLLPDDADNALDHLKDGKPCRDDEPEHRRRHHDDPVEKSSHHKKSDSDSDDDDSDSDSKSKAEDDDDDDDDSTSTQVKVVPKGSVDTGDGSSL